MRVIAVSLSPTADLWRRVAGPAGNLKSSTSRLTLIKVNSAIPLDTLGVILHWTREVVEICKVHASFNCLEDKLPWLHRWTALTADVERWTAAAAAAAAPSRERCKMSVSTSCYISCYIKSECLVKSLTQVKRITLKKKKKNCQLTHRFTRSHEVGDSLQRRAVCRYSFVLKTLS